jgi:hypothetical protein
VFGPKAQLVKRVDDVLLAAARAGEHELQAFAATIDRKRLAGATALATHLAESGALAPGRSVEHARDLIWLHTAPDAYRLLVLERGLNPGRLPAVAGQQPGRRPARRPRGFLAG